MAATPAAQYAIVGTAAHPRVPVPSNSALIVVGPSADHTELYDLLTHWFAMGDKDGFPVPYYIRKVDGPADDLAHTAENVVIHEDNGHYMAAWTDDAGYAAHPHALFGVIPESVRCEEIATMYKTRRPGFPRGAWVIVREPDGAELAVIATKRDALKRLHEIVADHFAEVAV